MEYILTFGKYKGWKIQDVFKQDTGYIYWLSQKSTNPVAVKAADAVIEQQMLVDQEIDKQLAQALHVICRQKKRPGIAPYKHGHIDVHKNVATIEMCTHKIHLEFEAGHGFTEDFHSADWSAVEIAMSHEDLEEVDEEEYDEGAWKKPQGLGHVPKAEDAIWYPIGPNHELLSRQAMTLEQAVNFLDEYLSKGQGL